MALEKVEKKIDSRHGERFTFSFELAEKPDKEQEFSISILAHEDESKEPVPVYTVEGQYNEDEKELEVWNCYPIDHAYLYGRLGTAGFLFAQLALKELGKEVKRFRASDIKNMFLAKRLIEQKFKQDKGIRGRVELKKKAKNAATEADIKKVLSSPEDRFQNTIEGMAKLMKVAGIKWKKPKAEEIWKQHEENMKKIAEGKAEDIEPITAEHLGIGEDLMKKYQEAIEKKRYDRNFGFAEEMIGEIKDKKGELVKGLFRRQFNPSYPFTVAHAFLNYFERRLGMED